jgi:uncharacterized membrane protein YkoI
VRSAITAIAAMLMATPALADHHGGYDHGAAQQRAAISQQRATEIAHAQGMAAIDEIELENGVWKIEGRTSEGRRIEVEISAENGAVLKRELY